MAFSAAAGTPAYPCCPEGDFRPISPVVKIMSHGGEVASGRDPLLPKERGQPGLLFSQKLLIIFNNINSSSLIFRQIEGSRFPGAA